MTPDQSLDRDYATSKRRSVWRECSAGCNLQLACFPMVIMHRHSWRVPRTCMKERIPSPPLKRPRSVAWPDHSPKSPSHRANP